MIKRLAVGGAALLALTGMSATGAMASTAGAPGLATRVVHADINGVKATITLRGGWRLGKKMPVPDLHAAKADAAAETYDWGGYVDTGHNVAFRFVAADFYAPNVYCTSSEVENGQSVADYAVGLGGWSTGNGEQVGFQNDCDPGTTPDLSYTSYWVIDGTGEAITGAVPGDLLSASVYYNPAGEYQLQVNDVTEPGGFSVTEACPSGSSCDNTAADVLSVAAGYNSSDPSASYGLADYGGALFETAAVTSRSGTRGTLSTSKLWSPTTVNTVDSGNNLMQSTGALTSGGTGFTETWKAVS